MKLLLAAALSVASIPDDLAACRQIPGDAQRLACYDALAPAPTPSPAPVAPAPAPAPAFGAEALPEQAEEPRQLRARLVGSLEGWRKGTRFVLDNGQVWQCVDDQAGAHELDRPALTIERGFGGSYWMRFESVNASVRVRRVR